MTEDLNHPTPKVPAEGEDLGPTLGSPEPWKTVYFGQLSQDLVPYHPDPPEAPEDELTRAALEDERDVRRAPPADSSAPTFWRLITVVAVAVIALALVFWR